MQSWQSPRNSPSRHSTTSACGESPGAAVCLQVVDAGLLGILFVAPFFFGGRHPMGRMVFVALACGTGVAWFTRQALLRQAVWTRSWVHLLGLAAIVLVAVQLVPLPPDWIEWLATRNSALLSLWTDDANQVPRLGAWQSLSLTPSSTRIVLATLVAYVLLLAVAVGRLREAADIERLLRLIALSALLMGGFGLLQYFTSNGTFFWFYEHPHTTTSRAVKGSFTCRSHFAHMMALGTAALIAWFAIRAHGNLSPPNHRRRDVDHPTNVGWTLALQAGLAMVVLAVLLSLSRGGAVALVVVATISVVLLCRYGLLSSNYVFGLIGLGVLAAAIMSTDDYDRVASRLSHLSSGSIETLDSQEGRRKIWSANVEAIREGGFFGSGAGSHREIYPVYLPESLQIEYTHAENGYLQVATENGWLGIVLLALAITMVGNWCWRAVRGAATKQQMILATAVSAGLAASLVHSLVDFVWFVPTTMSFTILLAACALRLSQLVENVGTESARCIVWPQTRWIGLAAASSLAAIWAVSTVAGPGTAALHWDRYLLSQKHIKRLPDDQKGAFQGSPNDPSIYHLRNTLTRDTQFARAHLRLAGKYLWQFNEQQLKANNRLSVDQIRDAAIASQFDSADALRQWLQQAFGENSRLLYQAYQQTRQALRLCPLQGQGYLYLAQLCFLEGGGIEAIDAYMDQALKVRPHDGRVLFEVGRQELLLGRVEPMLKHWQQVFPDTGSHQQRIVDLLAGHMPAAVFLEAFQPDWRTLRSIWARYRERGTASDWQVLIEYAADVTKQKSPQQPPSKLATNWLALSRMQTEIDQVPQAIESIQQAYAVAPSIYGVRRELGRALLRVGRRKQAEPHLRWCLARQPDNPGVRAELVKALTR